MVAEALDRLSRDQEDIAGLYKRLGFAGIAIVTLEDGPITDMHVGLKGTMNAMQLKVIADKTRRGLRGRIEAGLSAGGISYGYDIVRRIGPDGMPVRGLRRINPEQAAIVRRIFEEYAAGRSARAMAGRLNKEGVPGPFGGHGATPRSAGTSTAAPAYSTTSSTSDDGCGTGCATSRTRRPAADARA